MFQELGRIEISIWVPPLVAFAISFFTSMGGISGAFLLLPFQVSVLRFESPAVSATNQLYNIIAIPGGVYRYIREKRMLWPLAGAVTAGAAPGVIIGSFLRVELLPDPRHFKLFAGIVLLYVAVRLVTDLLKRRKDDRPRTEAHDEATPDVRVERWGLRRVYYSFNGATFRFSTPMIALIGFVVGIVGGIYGIGGGALIVPICVTFFRLPVHSIAGAALLATFATSAVGVLTFQVMSGFYDGVSVAPNWSLGILFGLGGLAGTYCGARMQKHMPATFIGWMLAACVAFVAVRYVLAPLEGS